MMSDCACWWGRRQAVVSTNDSVAMASQSSRSAPSHGACRGRTTNMSSATRRCWRAISRFDLLDPRSHRHRELERRALQPSSGSRQGRDNRAAHGLDGIGGMVLLPVWLPWLYLR